MPILPLLTLSKSPLSRAGVMPGAGDLSRHELMLGEVLGLGAGAGVMPGAGNR
jgi:hypothetical protein